MRLPGIVAYERSLYRYWNVCKQHYQQSNCGVFTGFAYRRVFHFIFDMMSYNSGGFVAQLLSGLSVNRHFESLSQGVLDTKDILFLQV